LATLNPKFPYEEENLPFRNGTQKDKRKMVWIKDKGIQKDDTNREA